MKILILFLMLISVPFSPASDGEKVSGHAPASIKEFFENGRKAVDAKKDKAPADAARSSGGAKPFTGKSVPFSEKSVLLEKMRMNTGFINSIDTLEVEKFVNEGGNIDSPGPDGQSLLVKAIRLRDADGLRFLIEKGAKIEKSGSWPHPLIMALESSSAEVFEVLMENHPAMPENVGSVKELFKIYVLSRQADPEKIKILLKYGADPETKLSGGETPLLFFLNLRKFDAAMAMIECGARTDVRDDRGNGFLHLMISAGKAGRSGPVNFSGPSRRVAREIIPSNFEKDDIRPVDTIAVGLLKRRPGALDEMNQAGETPLYLCVKHDNYPVFEELLRNGANKGGALGSDGVTLLHVASAYGRIDFMKRLLYDGADTGAVDVKGATPLHYAAMSDDTSSVSLLISLGADPKARDRSGSTPVKKYAQLGKMRHCEHILQNCRFEEIFNDTAEAAFVFFRAVEKSDLSVITKMIDSGFAADTPGFDGNTAVIRAAAVGAHDVLAALASRGADIERRNPSGDTPLMSLIRAGLSVETLLSHGAKIGKTDTSGNYEVHIAAISNNVAALRSLINRGARADAIDPMGRTPLHIAAGTGQSEMAEMLLSFGANPKIRDGSGTAPADILAAAGSEEIAAFRKISSSEVFVRRKDIPIKYGICFGRYPSLHRAVILKKYAALERLINEGENVHAADHDGLSAVDIAMDLKDVAAFETLMRNGAKVSVSSPFLPNFAMFLIKSGRVDQLFERVIASCPQAANMTVLHVDANNTYYEYPLICHAVMTRDIGLLKKLTAAGADLNLSSERNGTALHYVLRSMLDAENSSSGADKTSSFTSAELATLREMFDLLVSSGARYDAVQYFGSDRVIEELFEKGSEEILLKLFRGGADPSGKKTSDDYIHKRPLTMAFNKDMPRLSSLLIKKGASLEGFWSSQKNYMDMALDSWDFEAAVLLAAKGILPSSDRGAKETPLHAAIKKMLTSGAGRTAGGHRTSYSGITAFIAGICRAAGISPSAKDNEGSTPFDLIIRWNPEYEVMNSHYPWVDSDKKTSFALKFERLKNAVAMKKALICIYALAMNELSLSRIPFPGVYFK